MSIISKITMTEGVAVITLENVPANIESLTKLFSVIADDGINVDMVSLGAPKGPTTSVCLTAIQSNVPQIIKATKSAEALDKSVKTSVSVGTVKFSMYGENMNAETGVCTKVFQALSELKLEILLVTTSDVDISVVVMCNEADNVLKHLEEKLIG